MRALIVSVAIIVAAASVAQAQGCGQFTSCQVCVAQPQCGWCSSPVQYVNGSTGPQCAGFGAGATPFTCPDVYSTTTCVSGYNCDSSSGTCQLAPPGQGGTLAQCTANCRKNAQPVYACDDATKTCSEVPAGTPGSSSLEICQAVCSGSPTPSPGPVAPVYACSANFTCVPTTPGHGASKLVCEQQCNASNVLYLCSYTNGTCVQVPPLTPNGVPQAQCEQQCANVTPAPVPPAPSPPPELIGLWRGVAIENGYAILEFDALINNTYAAFSYTTTAAQTTFSGTPYHIPGSPTLEMWVVINEGPGAGLTVRMIADTSGERGPETEFATMAMGTPGGPTPASLVAAMTDGQSKVFALSKCIVNEQFCVFSFNGGSGGSGGETVSATRRLRNRLMRARPQIEAVAAEGGVADAAVAAAAVKKNNKEKVAESVGFTDRCTTYDQACSVCVAAGCGWCSVDVQYVLPNGTQQTGTQCAGTGGTPFTCGGFYTTSTCEVGYICDRTASGQSCVATVPGDGMPYDVCLQVCVATPPPAPRPPQYTCNLTTKTCAFCPSGACPGSMPQSQCESLCPNPYPGPTPDLLGIWRGVMVNQKYVPGEYDFVMATSGVTVYKDGVFFYNATIISLGSDVMIWTVASGAGAGSTLGVLYQMAMQSPAPDGRRRTKGDVGLTGFYWQMTMAIAPNSAPTEFDTPMYTDGDQEFVLAQCLKEPCVFNTV